MKKIVFVKIMLLTVLFCVISPFPTKRAGAQWIPVGAVFDSVLGFASTLVTGVEVYQQYLHKQEKPFHEKIKNIQEFFGKSKTVVNGAVRQLRMVKEIVELNTKIGKLFQKTISTINGGQDLDGDGEDDLALLDKWKHIQVLVAISGEALGVFGLFTNVMDGDATVMGDKARVENIERIYRELRAIYSGMRVQIRRINQEIFNIKRYRDEASLYGKFYKVTG